MPRNPPGNDIDDSAALWAAKTDGGTLSAEQQTELDRWLAADARHAGAYARALAVLAYYDEALGDEGRDGGPGSPGAEERPTLNRRRLFMGGGVAASLLVAGGAAVFWSGSSEQAYATERGEIRRVALPNGDVVTLNTESRISVRRSRSDCKVTLLEGEALFVASGSGEMPLAVECPGADVTLRPLDASFVLRSIDGETSFLVQSGAVEVVSDRGDRQIVRMNERAVLPGRGEVRLEAAPAEQIERALAWRSGMIAFDDDSLRDAVAEFARYNATPIVLADDAAAARRVSGLFAANDPRGFARAVSLSLGLKAEVSGSSIRISSPG